jgi:ABC-type antimicrobial peptide transport system permease subunit
MKLLTLLKFLWDDLVYDAIRSCLTVINLCAVLVSFFLLAAISVGLGLAGRQKAPENILLVLEKQTIDPMQSRMEVETLNEIASLGPGHVKRVFPFTFHHLNINNYLVQVRGVPPEEFFRTFELKLNDGRMPQAPDEIVISEGAVHYASWSLGDILTVYGSDFRVSGIVQMPESTFATVWMPLETAERTFQNQGIYQGATVVIPEGVNPEEIQFMIETLPALKNRYAAFLIDDVYFRFARALKAAWIISIILTWISLFRITLGVYHTIHLNLEERGRELILLYAAGLSIRGLQKILLARIAFLMFIAYFLAWAIAEAIIYHFERTSPIVLHGEHIPVILNTEMLLSGFSLMLVFCVLGVWFPTRRIAAGGILSLNGD